MRNYAEETFYERNILTLFIIILVLVIGVLTTMGYPALKNMLTLELPQL